MIAPERLFSGGTDMCEKCAELDAGIEFCRLVAARSDTDLRRQGLEMLIESYSAEKVALHTMAGAETVGVESSAHSNH